MDVNATMSDGKGIMVVVFSIIAIAAVACLLIAWGNGIEKTSSGNEPAKSIGHGISIYGWYVFAAFVIAVIIALAIIIAKR